MLELDKGIQQYSIPHGYRKKQVSTSLNERTCKVLVKIKS